MKFVKFKFSQLIIETSESKEIDEHPGRQLQCNLFSTKKNSLVFAKQLRRAGPQVAMPSWSEIFNDIFGEQANEIFDYTFNCHWQAATFLQCLFIKTFDFTIGLCVVLEVFQTSFVTEETTSLHQWIASCFI
jgi:hypothetical protein